MDHDHDPKHKVRCNHQGLMSYNTVPVQWSPCSIDDFKNWWRKRGQMCMKTLKTVKAKFDKNEASDIKKGKNKL